LRALFLGFPVLSCIAFIDSGVGGLSVLEAVQASHPNSQLIYLADQAFAPYGNKTPQWVANRTLEIATYLNQQHTLDCIVIACNTASTLSLQLLRANITTPIVGVVPAIKPAAEQSVTGKIGLLATPATIQGQYIQDLISEHANHCQVTKVASTELVLMAEAKLAGIPVDLKKLAKIVQPIMKDNCDYVVLGCTHFPLLRPELNTLYPNTCFIDSAQAIARRISDIVKPSPLKKNSLSNTFYSTRSINQTLSEYVLNIGFNHIHHLDLTKATLIHCDS